MIRMALPPKAGVAWDARAGRKDERRGHRASFGVFQRLL
jgi:hypothetical protein